MSKRWNIPNIPHKGWSLQNVIDVRGEDQGPDDTNYQTCMMCNKEHIRYVHIVTHPDIQEEFSVGCICAQKMTGDYVTPKLKEKALKMRAARRISWAKKKWKTTENGNHTCKYDKRCLRIFKDKWTNKFKCKIGDVWGKLTFSTIEEAKNAVYLGIEYLKKRGE